MILFELGSAESPIHPAGGAVPPFCKIDQQHALGFDSMKGLNAMNRDVAKRLLELAETGLEGLEYVKEQNGQGNFEQAMSVFTDVIHSFSEIENVLNTNQPEQGDADLATAIESLRDGFNWMVKAYESQEQGGTLGIMQLTLIPRYKSWQEELEKSLGRYIVS